MDLETPFSISKDFVAPNFGHDCRSLFFTNSDRILLNHASFGTIPKPVQRACEALTRECEGDPDLFIRDQLFGRVSAAREALSKIVGADPDSCVFISNVATATNTVLRNFDWSSEDYIIHTDAIWESISLAVKSISNAPRTSVFDLGESLSHELILKRFRAHINNVKKEMRLRSMEPLSKSRDSPKIVVIMESITANPSLLLPWRDMVKICREENVWSIVDAAHSLGQERAEINLTETDPDFWMANCSKWYFAHRGCALLYVPFRNQDMIQSQLLPGLPLPLRGAEPTNFIHKFFWAGLIDPVPYLSVEFAIAFRRRLGGEKKINDYCHSLAVEGGRLVAKILGTKVMDSTEEGELTANMTNFELPIPSTIKPSKEMFFLFQDELIGVHNTFVPPFYYKGRWYARASAQIYNDLSDFEHLGEALVETCRKIMEWNSSPVQIL
ncbi:pyridoxal phosphate-dependent transferase [Gymnopilus junonius]|uniref:Pyridoxal phosphate-dependent transferase n=1 Tax=Gymnopilus junonius TaxID=109634 RepID=A0A9P5NVU4_GYMJU|nr:pyridoxal phosphate-dependent transferase [Gymnopilus junonius]